MQIIYCGTLYWLDNDSSLRMIDGMPAPILGVFEGTTYPPPPWSITI